MELRDLVRQLGRGGGKGPLRRAPEEVSRWSDGGRGGGSEGGGGIKNKCPFHALRVPCL